MICFLMELIFRPDFRSPSQFYDHGKTIYNINFPEFDNFVLLGMFFCCYIPQYLTKNITQHNLFILIYLSFYKD